MKTQNWKLGIIVSAFLWAALTLNAQQRFGGFGGSSGSSRGGSGSSRGAAGGSSQQQYNPSGVVGSATISVDPDTRNITVIADEETMKAISEVIKSLDVPRPQVLIKVVFLEVQHSNGSDIGIEGGWGGNVGNANTKGAFANGLGLSGLSSAVSSNANSLGQSLSNFLPMPPGAGLYQVLGKDFQVTLRAIAQAGKAQLLSRPSILARDSQPASIIVGQSVPLITSVRYDTFGNAINSVTYTDVGIILKVTPFITGDGLVQMIVSPNSSSIDPTTTVPISTGVNAPVIDQRNADTVVVTPDGQTIVIGGLMRNDRTDSENKIPILGDIPFLGNLFKRKIKNNIKTELLIFLTPHVVNAPGQLAAVGTKERNQVTMPDSDSERELNRFLDQIPMKDTDNTDKRRPNRK